MKLRVMLNPLVEATVDTKPFKLEAPNHKTLMLMIDVIREENTEFELFYNCQKHNKKPLGDGFFIASKWTANVYLFEPEVSKLLYMRQNARNFDVSMKPLPDFVNKLKLNNRKNPKSVSVSKVANSELVSVIQNVGRISNSPETIQSALV